jgi:hypothetical protein
MSNKNKKITTIGPAPTDGEIVDKSTVSEAVKQELAAVTQTNEESLDSKTARLDKANEVVLNSHKEKANIAFELLKASLTQKSVELSSMRDNDMDTLVSQSMNLANKFKAAVDARYTTELDALTKSIFGSPTQAAAPVAASSESTGPLN